MYVYITAAYICMPMPTLQWDTNSSGFFERSHVPVFYHTHCSVCTLIFIRNRPQIEISVITLFLSTSCNLHGYTCALNPLTVLAKAKQKTTGSKMCRSCSCPFPIAMQEGDWDKPLLCNNTCNMGKVGRRDDSQMEKAMRVEKRKVSNVHMLCPKVGMTYRKSGEQMLPLVS